MEYFPSLLARWGIRTWRDACFKEQDQQSTEHSNTKALNINREYDNNY